MVNKMFCSATDKDKIWANPDIQRTGCQRNAITYSAVGLDPAIDSVLLAFAEDFDVAIEQLSCEFDAGRYGSAVIEEYLSCLGSAVTDKSRHSEKAVKRIEAYHGAGFKADMFRPLPINSVAASCPPNPFTTLMPFPRPSKSTPGLIFYSNSLTLFEEDPFDKFQKFLVPHYLDVYPNVEDDTLPEGERNFYESRYRHPLVFQRFGELKRFSGHAGLRRPDVVFMDVHHRYRGAEGSGKESGANVNTASRQEELSEPQAPFGKVVSSKQCVFINEFLSPSGGEAYVSKAQKTSSLGPLRCLLKLGKPLDPTTSSGPAASSRSSGRWCAGREVRTSHRMCSGSVGCPVPTDTSWFPQISGVDLGLNGFAHVELASTQERFLAACQGTAHDFCYMQRSLDVDFAPAPLQWTYDFPTVVRATVSMHPNRLWRAYEVQENKKGGEKEGGG
ncbi:hypothetical protein BJV77DRAFT_966928 [Russula vinacea]|nr:hypothetical protein BJV77DRAFT_966928 [Russula vinacea]